MPLLLLLHRSCVFRHLIDSQIVAEKVVRSTSIRRFNRAGWLIIWSSAGSFPSLGNRQHFPSQCHNGWDTRKFWSCEAEPSAIPFASASSHPRPTCQIWGMEKDRKQAISEPKGASQMANHLIQWAPPVFQSAEFRRLQNRSLWLGRRARTRPKTSRHGTETSTWNNAQNPPKSSSSSKSWKSTKIHQNHSFSFSPFSPGCAVWPSPKLWSQEETRGRMESQYRQYPWKKMKESFGMMRRLSNDRNRTPNNDENISQQPWESNRTLVDFRRFEQRAGSYGWKLDRRKRKIKKTSLGSNFHLKKK